MKTNIFIPIMLAITVSISSCETDNSSPGSNNPSNNAGGDWLIPQNEVRDGGPGKDGIPALQTPQRVSVDDASNHYLEDEDLVLGYYYGGEVVAYPHDILDWHEIINDRVGGQSIAVTYCPLTGTGIGWGRILEEEETTFGVSGLLYNSNLIPYDRKTGSNWSQIRLECVNGSLIGVDPVILPLVEMPWKTWKKLFPGSMVISTSTGHSRSYGSYPYGNYKTSNTLIFPANPSDDRLHPKERVLSIVQGGSAKVYRFENFGVGGSVIQDEFKGTDLVIAGSRDGYMVAYNAKTWDGHVPEFSTGVDGGIIMDKEGNEWNLFGTAVSGPRKGEQLKPVKSFMAYWFSIGAFYPEPELYTAGSE
jgi:hypothetical protein